MAVMEDDGSSLSWVIRGLGVGSWFNMCSISFSYVSKTPPMNNILDCGAERQKDFSQRFQVENELYFENSLLVTSFYEQMYDTRWSAVACRSSTSTEVLTHRPHSGNIFVVSLTRVKLSAERALKGNATHWVSNLNVVFQFY